MNVKQLMDILNMLPLDTEVLVENHHREEKPIVDKRIQFSKSGPLVKGLVLVLGEEKL